MKSNKRYLLEKNAEYLRLLELLEYMLMNDNSIHQKSIIRGAIQVAIGKEVEIKSE